MVKDLPEKRLSWGGKPRERWRKVQPFDLAQGREPVERCPVHPSSSSATDDGRLVPHSGAPPIPPNAIFRQ